VGYGSAQHEMQVSDLFTTNAPETLFYKPSTPNTKPQLLHDPGMFPLSMLTV
jgi:hypothetical protein